MLILKKALVTCEIKKSEFSLHDFHLLFVVCCRLFVVFLYCLVGCKFKILGMFACCAFFF